MPRVQNDMRGNSPAMAQAKSAPARLGSEGRRGASLM